MKIFDTVEQVRAEVSGILLQHEEIGFVPTMGALHKGHIDLIKRATRENGHVFCSIFVNPMQFNNPDDLRSYPRTFEKDVRMLEETGCQYLFKPSVEEIYPEKPGEKYDFGPLETVMEGKYRPGHFIGVAIVVKRLFDIITPHRAYFGEKDLQQLAIIRSLVKQEHLKVDIVPCSTVRESDGLAMSSRNTLLTPDQRKRADIIYKLLLWSKNNFAGKSIQELKNYVEKQISSQEDMHLDYFEIVEPDTLKPIDKKKHGDVAYGCIAVNLGVVRLIDNMFFHS
ncbi:MAG: pantoate--beta-alanine ligase [Bacteroidota bacterium]